MGKQAIFEQNASMHAAWPIDSVEQRGGCNRCIALVQGEHKLYESTLY